MCGSTGNTTQPFFIGVAGGTASGKKTVCEQILRHLGGQRVAILSLFDFSRELSAEEYANFADVNFDDPDAYDLRGLLTCLDKMRAAQAVEVPVYDAATCRREARRRLIKPMDVVIVEGQLVLHYPDLLKRLNMKLYVDTDDDVRLARRVRRDSIDRKMDVMEVINRYVRFVKPSHEKYVRPSKTTADVVIPWRQDNPSAVDLITQHVRSKLQQTDLTRIYRNLHLMPSSPQLRGMHTVIRDIRSSRTDFVFYSDRLIRLVVEYALGFLPCTEKKVQTPSGDFYEGLEFVGNVCGVSIIRSGEAMEGALRQCCKGIRIGKILLNDSGDANRQVIYEKMPRDIARRHVLVLRPVLGDGHVIKSTVDYLVNKSKVDEEKIIVLTLIAAPEGIRNVCDAFPRLKVVTSEIDDSLDNGKVMPGIGDFGDRYFGTASACDEPCQPSGEKDSSDTPASTCAGSGDYPSSASSSQ